MANELILTTTHSEYFISDGGGDTVGIVVAVGNDPYDVGNGPTSGAMRFTNVPIPQGSTFSFCKLVYKYANVGVATSGSWKFIVKGVKEVNTAHFSSGSPLGRPQTTTSLTFNEGRPTSGGTKEMDVGPIIEEIVGQGGWSSNNALAITLFDDGSDADVGASTTDTTCYLVYRISTEPNFTPTPTNVTAPSLPSAGDVGMKFSEPGVSVFTATDDQCYLTTRKKTVKLLEEDIYTADAVEIVAVPHGLGYIPFVTVYAQEVGQDWRKIPRSSASTDIPFYFLDTDNLYLSSSEIGQKFYYRIFIDRIV